MKKTSKGKGERQLQGQTSERKFHASYFFLYPKEATSTKARARARARATTKELTTTSRNQWEYGSEKVSCHLSFDLMPRLSFFDVRRS